MSEKSNATPQAAGLEQVEHQQAEEISRLEAEIDRGEERRRQLEEEMHSLERLSVLLNELIDKFTGHDHQLHEGLSHLSEAFEEAERDSLALNEMMEQGLEAARPAREEIVAGLDQLEVDLTSQCEAKVTQSIDVSHETHTGFQGTVNQEWQKFEEEFSSTAAFFADLSESTEQLNVMLESGRTEHQESYGQVEQRFSECHEEIGQLRDGLAQAMAEAGNELLNQHLARIQSELNNLDQQTHEKLSADLEQGLDGLKVESLQQLTSFGREVLETGDAVGDATKKILDDLIHHTESDLKEAAGASFVDLSRYGVEVLIKEIAIQIVEAAAGQTIAMTLPELAAAIKAAQVALEARKVQRGVTNAVVDGVKDIGDFIGGIF